MPRLPTPPKISLPTIRSPLPIVPISPILSNIAPPRTLTGQIPPGIRDLVRYSGLVGKTARQLLGVSPSVKQGQELLGSASPRDTGGYTGGESGGTPVLRGFLSDIVSDSGRTDILFFQFNPSEVRVTHAPGWIISQVPGRSHPFIQYGGSGQRKITFTLKLAYTLNDVGNVQDNVNWIHSFLFPSSFGDTAEELITAPKPLFLYLGQILAHGDLAQSVPVIMLKADVRYHTMMRPIDLSPQFADISLEFLVLLDTSTGRPVQTGAEQRSSFGELDKFVRREIATGGIL